jgi:hypothetical protein
MRALGLGLTLAFPVAALAQAPLYDLSGQTGDEFGKSVAAIGDIDGDGFGDVAIGGPFGDGYQPDAGYVNLYSGRTGYSIRQLKGLATGDHFGWSVAGLGGDIDGDGVSDLIVGAPYHDSTLGTDAGSVYLVSGATGAYLWIYGGNAADDWLGWAVSAVGDVDLDGVVDFAMGQPGLNLGMSTPDCGRVTVASGADFTHIQSWLGEAAGDFFGWSIAACGDLSGDGKPDLIVGAPYFDTGFALPAGRAYLAKTNGLPTPPTVLSTGSSTGGHLGHCVASGFDFDHDGFQDIALGEPYYATAGTPRGRVRVISGANLALAQTLLGTNDDQFGWAVAGLHDFDADGYGDLVVGLPGGDSGSADLGVARVFSGHTWTALSECVGYASGDKMGLAVASAGLLNNDPWTDMICAAPSSSVHGLYCGRARLVLGNADYPLMYCTSKTNSAGCVPFISYTGCASVSISDGFHLEAREVLLGVNGMLIWALSPNSAPFYGGTLCIGFPIHRTPVQTSTNVAAFNCPGLYNFHFSHAYMASFALGAGTDVFAQYWSRDNGFAAPNNVGLTNGLKFTLLP